MVVVVLAALGEEPVEATMGVPVVGGVGVGVVALVGGGEKVGYR